MTIYNIFISHAWKYSEAYNQVVRWLNEAQSEGYLVWKNYSVPEHDPLVDPGTFTGQRQLQTMLSGQIRPATKIIIISGMYAAHSSWIDFEIDTAVGFGKYIVGLKPWGQERIPLKISNNADVMVGWNKMSLINAIRGS